MKIYLDSKVIKKELNQEMLKEFQMIINRQQQKQEQLKKSLQQIKAPIKATMPIHFYAHQAIKVLQHEYAMTTADSHQPIVGSFGAGPCIILALYDQNNKVAILAHIDEFTDIDSLQELINIPSKTCTVAHLIGGYDDSDKFNEEIDMKLCIEIFALLEKNQIQIEHADVARYTKESASLAIDARTGYIYSPVESHQLETYDLDERLSILKQSFKSPLVQYKPNLQKDLSSVLDQETCADFDNQIRKNQF